MRHIEIKIVPEGQVKKEIHRMTYNVLHHRGYEKSTEVWLKPEYFPRIFSEKRIELLMTLCKKPAGTISELAKRLDRPFEVVYRDLQLFKEYDMVKLTKVKGGAVVARLAGDIHLPILRVQQHKKAFKANKGLLSASAAVSAARKAS